MLTGAAAVDLWRRPQREIHGWKGVWWLGIFVQPFGPIAYLAYGRRRGRGR
ncbi:MULTISPECIES: PLDc N-terminal domain-containing protein [unclassified Nonomuraea]|uniref:PLDc N-terminal domain-containing protein n=1 Tax=unclassified Nonomuraea TaxID=2593643 RepID=UPI00340875BD